jgi:hypothetical protein
LGWKKNDTSKNSGMLVGSAFFVRKDDKSVVLIEEWYSICHKKKNLINDSASQYPNDPEFIDHRHDQSIFSLLRKLNGSLIIPDETFFTDWEKNKEFPIHIKRIK